jgi:hypothetical protein
MEGREIQASFEVDLVEDVQRIIYDLLDCVSFVNLAFCSRKFNLQLTSRKRKMLKSLYLKELGASNSMKLLLDVARYLDHKDFDWLIRGLFDGGNRQFLEFVLSSPECDAYPPLVLLRSATSLLLPELIPTYVEFAISQRRIDFLQWLIDLIHSKGLKIPLDYFQREICCTACSFRTVDGLRWALQNFPLDTYERIASFGMSLGYLGDAEMESQMLRLVEESLGTNAKEITHLHTLYNSCRTPFMTNSTPVDESYQIIRSVTHHLKKGCRNLSLESDFEH